ncbi:aspartyl-phosphate phosphatase Spo0E family protein [Paenibacillus agilis]|uniref:Spo0E family sporulation regulatory protein-aspartic acid phosphatase n=1 Tax=Paenibacillus agilis TaxID=3020863 RepID=A0A559J2R4_9BACL|nr:Spo0E family sporulation regulatory protein-aspartic acid phosphatase [Paenibacillus agilis]
MLSEIECLRIQMHKAYEEGATLLDVQMINMSQSLDKLLTEYQLARKYESNSLHKWPMNRNNDCQR